MTGETFAKKKQEDEERDYRTTPREGQQGGRLRRNEKCCMSWKRYHVV